MTPGRTPTTIVTFKTAKNIDIIEGDKGGDKCRNPFQNYPPLPPTKACVHMNSSKHHMAAWFDWLVNTVSRVPQHRSLNNGC